MRIAIGADHAGFTLKARLTERLRASGHEVDDLGPSSAESVDYPDYAAAVAGSVAQGDVNLGVLVCGTGLGMAIAANKIPGVRAVTCSETFSARMARLHNDANVLTLGSRVIGEGLALDVLQVFLDTEFEGGRHQRRVEKIDALSTF
ncbi:MAG: ribose 5-phosphate isomerase B [Acidobacteriota bacterium]